jgi:hypothetical protein
VRRPAVDSLLSFFFVNMQIHGHLQPENGLIDSLSVIVRIAEAGVDGIAPRDSLTLKINRIRLFSTAFPTPFPTRE